MEVKGVPPRSMIVMGNYISTQIYWRSMSYGINCSQKIIKNIMNSIYRGVKRGLALSTPLRFLLRWCRCLICEKRLFLEMEAQEALFFSRIYKF